MDTPAPDAPQPAAEWRSALDGLLRPAQNTEHVEQSATAMALQFELRELVPRTASRWNGPPSKAATSVKAGVEYRLGVRPVARTSRGWARGTLTWSNIARLRNRLNLEPAQHLWFCQFVALHRAATPAAAGHDADWVLLDEFANPLLWAMLAQASSCGVQLVATKSDTAVLIGDAATLTLDAVAAGNAIIISPSLTVDGLAVPVESAGPIGNHGVYVFALARPRSFHLAPTAEQMTREQISILNSGFSLRIPQQNFQEFIQTDLDQLRESIDIGSSDTSVTLPQCALRCWSSRRHLAPGISFRLSGAGKKAGGQERFQS
ncbi:hypothetical protein EH165_03225 [Nakamurella antarctica]|uniref:Uncharacterized protein n=1 Tax=Nakamurella antarctica TaxID=1902245 RepID=A0A3G8ZJE5_9ACTN|nr:hypothetical protein [Nakamurella antarctica]AZI57318.1 hypothetical protein EH165_03225 [Nakamurella antarctica]